MGEGKLMGEGSVGLSATEAERGAQGVRTGPQSIRLALAGCSMEKVPLVENAEAANAPSRA
jgi:hypothetical protein